MRLQLNEKDEKHEEEVSNLKKEIYALNHELEQSNLKFRQLLSDHQVHEYSFFSLHNLTTITVYFQSTVEQLKKEQQEIKRDYVNKVNKLKETEIELSTLKNAHKSYVSEVAPKLEAVSEILSKRFPFSDEGKCF